MDYPCEGNSNGCFLERIEYRFILVAVNDWGQSQVPEWVCI